MRAKINEMEIKNKNKNKELNKHKAGSLKK
jgi:hypothetical protein